jgi:glutamate 5-kinase
MSTIEGLLTACSEIDVIPIINGNDALDPTGSDNDLIAAGVAVACAARKLLLPTNVDGVCEQWPSKSRPLDPIRVEELHRLRIPSSGPGRGGMRSKLRASELAGLNGLETPIVFL